MRLCHALFTLLTLAPALMACRRSESTPQPTVASASAAALSTSAAAPPAAGPTSATPAAAAGTCPTGRWEYDYSDTFLESITRTSPNARVVSERGKLICTISGQERGSYSCQVTEGGVENVFEANVGGGNMQITVKIDGHSKVDYEPAGPGKWRTTTADLSTLNIQASAKLGGRNIPMPFADSFKHLTRPGTILEYRCEGDTLKFKPQAENVPDWAILKRVP